MGIIGPPGGGGGLLPESVITEFLAKEAVTTAKIQALAITAVQIAKETISKEKLTKALQEEVEKAGKEGKEGPAGPTGKEGKEGPAGPEGKEGPAGKEGKEGKEGTSEPGEWQEIENLEADWVNGTGGSKKLQCRKLNGKTIELRGSLERTTATYKTEELICNLPAGFHPTGTVVLAGAYVEGSTAATTGGCGVKISGAGQISIINGTATHLPTAGKLVFFDGLVFPTN